jgi:hypothetical protein
VTTDDLTTARLDAPVAEVLADLDRLHAKLLAAEVAPELLVQVHEFLDIDPDLAGRVYPPMPHARTGVYPDTSSSANFLASDDANLTPPVDWYADPPQPTRRPLGSPDCQPEFSQKLRRTVEDVQTGGAL